ncbi:DedA family protein [Actinomycetospora endophytica]|uniref:DedA family protein n=1 Tax=Actinomycetospora endophytica TaxID=2291215 RepID=A0ABS8P728_9PSEU|nr:DedA family protein [Actinomycetospora endophytica]MCD2194054.1 DedA family protein [Actinomycetospora endophytica]
MGEPDEGAPTPSTKGSPRRPWSRREYTPEEIEAAKQQWRDIRPWEHPMARADKVLIFSTVAVTVLLLGSLPVRPFLLATHPVALSAVTGSLSAVGAASAFARIGGTDVWLVVAAGVFGMIKFDWLFWWAGRRWGAKGVRFFTPPGRATRFVERVRSWPPWTIGLIVIAAALPGVPSVPLFLLAGLAGLPLVVFLVLDAIGSALVVGLVAGLGYGLGQTAVDVVLKVDQYALWVSIALILVISFRAGRRGQPSTAGR